MLTVDDANTIYEKYKLTNYLYKIDLTLTPPVRNKQYKYDFCSISYITSYDIFPESSFWTGGYFLKHKTTGEYLEGTYTRESPFDNHLEISSEIAEEYDLYLHMAVDTDITYSPQNLIYWHPISPVTMAVYPDGTYIPNKIYLDINPDYIESYQYIRAGSGTSKTCTTNPVEVKHDDEGYYIDGFVWDASHTIFRIKADDLSFYGNIHHLKQLPLLSGDLLYKGTSQQIKLKTGEDNYITDFQAYYQGRKLKDNIISLPYDAPDGVTIVVDLFDPNYVNARLKLTIPSELYYCDDLEGLEQAIDMGIRTVQFEMDTDDDPVSVDIADFNFVDSTIKMANSTFNNTLITDSLVLDCEGNVFTNCVLTEMEVRTGNSTMFHPIKYNDCNISHCSFLDMELHLTGSIQESFLNQSLIISDGTVEIIDNSFNTELVNFGDTNKEYFPSFLYVTGDYTCKNNNFKLTGIWSSLGFNMCVIKTVEGFNASQFINNNTFELTVQYGSEPTNTFYYNIVDDDKIKAVRLS